MIVTLEQCLRWTDAAPKLPVFVCLLGELRLLRWGQPVAIPRGGKLEALLTALVLHHEQGIPRDDLLAMLWPNQAPARAAQSLSRLISDLRKHLKDCLDGAPLILQTEHGYKLNYAAGISSDILCFEANVRLGHEQWTRHHFSEALASYHYILKLYQGDLCGGTDLYTTIERERIRIVYLTVVARLADYYYAQDQGELARDFAQQLLADDPCREDAHRLLMRCYARLGQRAEALRQYHLCAQILRTEFDAAPDPATTRLYEQLRLNPDSIGVKTETDFSPDRDPNLSRISDGIQTGFTSA